MTKNEFDLSSLDLDDPTVTLNVNISDLLSDDLKITVYKNGISTGVASHKQGLNKTVEIENGDVFEFECVGTITGGRKRELKLIYEGREIGGETINVPGVEIKTSSISLNPSAAATVVNVNESLVATVCCSNCAISDKDPIEFIGNIGSIKCYIV
jgi:hypothetical protein